MKKLIQKIKCLFGFHEEIRTEEKLGYWMGMFPTTKITYICKHCGHKEEFITSSLF